MDKFYKDLETFKEDSYEIVKNTCLLLLAIEDSLEESERNEVLLKNLMEHTYREINFKKKITLLTLFSYPLLDHTLIISSVRKKVLLQFYTILAENADDVSRLKFSVFNLFYFLWFDEMRREIKYFLETDSIPKM